MPTRENVFVSCVFCVVSLHWNTPNYDLSKFATFKYMLAYLFMHTIFTVRVCGCRPMLKQERRQGKVCEGHAVGFSLHFPLNCVVFSASLGLGLNSSTAFIGGGAKTAEHPYTHMC